ncbi:MAG: signal peptide peptidase SppA [Syntrophales bacterium]|nr:signal peptide peptidase SppA [Syntrophales bacterium]MDD5532959.1 signal peptide peptidase SppA [Syntrophales bacterium]HPL64521.1 signal peptide peptidase SppA [Syntrophales bacterium]
MRKHPVLSGVLLLFAVGILLFVFTSGLSVFRGERKSLSGDRVGIVPIKGIITDSKTIIEQITKYGDDSRIKAVVIRIDSPGGGVAPSQEIYDAVLELRKKKNVVASMGSVAASGGYYIACAAERIIANPGSVTGSIGAVMHFSNFEETLKKLGIRASVVKSGRYKDSGSPLRDMTSEERNLFQGVIDDIHDQFVEAVSANRKIPKEKMKEYADGRIFTGRQALKLGLVDSLGDLESAVRTVAELAGIKGKPDIVYPKEKGISFWKYLLEEASSQITGKLKEELTGAYFLSPASRMRIEY